LISPPELPRTSPEEQHESLFGQSMLALRFLIRSVQAHSQRRRCQLEGGKGCEEQNACCGTASHSPP
jgi:hypothetical protein